MVYCVTVTMMFAISTSESTKCFIHAIESCCFFPSFEHKKQILMKTKNDMNTFLDHLLEMMQSYDYSLWFKAFDCKLLQNKCYEKE
ncbi:hypothetical protein TNIN_344611 [Trichonephila inaurata madagascariensis]|uniref:Uncharacterized protein n=1 Tax=Trichonephila inaurata madagascariensis TaxID=2747483 RepID=A0A8X6IEY6_9ARAC|nr:hypothetical protein TNIN_344611 [Trichonephila inaurata madagascariensis]